MCLSNIFFIDPIRRQPNVPGARATTPSCPYCSSLFFFPARISGGRMTKSKPAVFFRQSDFLVFTKPFSLFCALSIQPLFSFVK